MNISGKPTNQSPDVLQWIRRSKLDLRNQIINEHSSSYTKAAVGLPSALQLSPCWQVANDRLRKLSSQNRVQNFNLSTYLPSRELTVVKQGDGNIGSSACGSLHLQHGEGALRNGSIRKRQSQSLDCEHNRFVRTAVRPRPVRNNM